MRSPSEKDKKILKEAHDRLRKAIDEDNENRQAAKEDLEFIAVEGKQWPEAIRVERESEGRPCITVNKMPVYIDQVVGDQRMNRPSIKVIPVDSKADSKVATILGGWIKHTQQISKSDIAIDHGFEHAVACGYGAWRVITKYTSDSAFEQEAYIEKIDNALSVFWGKHSEYDCSDALYCFIITDMDKEEYKEKYKVDSMPFNAASDQYVEGWATKDTVRVAEYFVKESFEKTIYLLEDNKAVDKLEEGQVPIRTRKVQSYKVVWYLLSGDRILDSREWLGKKYIPVIPVWGKEINVAGKRYIRGLIRNAKDSQRMYNYWNSLDTEIIALQPKVPYLLTAAQVKGHETHWKQAHKKNYSYLLVNADKDAPGWPHREAPPQASSALVEKLRETDQEMRDTVGLQRASLGMQSNERSGVAIQERKKEGDVGTFAFIDNLSRSLEHTGRVLVDIAPALLDTERIIRLGLVNGEYEFTQINVESSEGNVLNDLSVGTYDVVVTVGPSFTTQRTEANQSMREFIQYYPNAAPLIGDLYAKSMDWPGAEEVSQRLEFLLPPEIKAKKAADAAAKAGETAPPPAEPPVPPPNPAEEVNLEQEKVSLEKLKIQTAQEQEKLKGMQLDNVIKEKEFSQLNTTENILPKKEEESIKSTEPTQSKSDNDAATQLWLKEHSAEIGGTDASSI
jgi:hypothetical protein